MFSKPEKIEEKSKRVFTTFKETTWLWFSFVFSSWITNALMNSFYKLKRLSFNMKLESQ